MSIETTSATASPSNKAGIAAKFLAPLIIGTATALGTPSAQAAELPPPTPKVLEIRPQEAKYLSPVFAFHDTAGGKFLFGYATGSIAGHLLEKLSQRNKHKELEEEVDQLKDQLENTPPIPPKVIDKFSGGAGI